MIAGELQIGVDTACVGAWFLREHRGPLTGEKRLACAILDQAINDILISNWHRRVKRKLAGDHARDWIRKQDGMFVHYCELLDLDPDVVSATILRKTTAPRAGRRRLINTVKRLDRRMSC